MLAAYDAVLRWVERLSRLFAWLGGVMLLAMVVLICLEIVLRRLAGVSLGLSFEYSGYVLGVAASWSFAYALFHKAHIRIDAAYVRLAAKGRIALDLVAMAAFAAFAVMCAQAALGVLTETLDRGTVSNTPLHTPMWIPQLLWVMGWLWFAVATVLLLGRVGLALAAGDFAAVTRLAGGATIDEQIEEEAPSAEEIGK